MAYRRGFRPSQVLFDSWYSSLENLKLARECGWVWLTQFRCNRRVNPDGRGNVRVDAVEIPPEGREVHLRGYGFVKVFRTVSPNGDVEHWAANDPGMTPEQQEEAERPGLGDRAIPPGAEAVLRGGEVPSAEGSIAAESHRDGDTSLRAPGNSTPALRRQLVRGRGRHCPFRYPALSGSTPVLLKPNCVSSYPDSDNDAVAERLPKFPPP